MLAEVPEVNPTFETNSNLKENHKAEILGP
jgi:hypothetical protein